MSVILTEDQGAEIEALGHDWGEWNVTIEPTYTDKGLKERVCSRCDEVETEEIAVIGKISIEDATVSDVVAKVYTGKALTQDPTVELDDVILEEGTDYKLAYSNNKNVGTATVKITGIGGYEGTISVAFVINPKPTTMKSLTSLKKGFTAKWTKKTVQTTGYQVQYALDSSFTTGKKTLTITSYKTVSKKVTKLKAKKKYYVRVRTYKTVSGKKYYSTWSKYKAVTTKK